MGQKPLSMAYNFFRNLIRTTGFWQANRLILREFRHFRWIVILAVSFTLAAALFEGISVGFIATFLQGLTNPDEPPIRTGLQWFDTFFLAVDSSTEQRIYRLSGLLLIIVWMRAGFDYLGVVCAKDAALRLITRLRCLMFEQLVSFQISFYSKASPGALISVVRGEINQIQQAFSSLSNMVVHSSKVLAYLISMLLLSWQLFLVSIMMFGLISVGLSSLTGRVREAGFEVPKANKAFTSNALSFINGMRTIRVSGTQSFERRAYRTTVRNIYSAQLALDRLALLVRPLIEGLGATLLVSMISVSFGLLIVTEKLKAAELLTFLFVLLRTTPLISALNGSWVKLLATQGSLNAVSDLLRRDDKAYFQDGQTLFTGLKHSIEFKSVDFAYEPGEPVLNNISFSIKQGETVALVGGSGAGKTTLADLIPRLYDPNEGKVLIDGIDLRELQINSLREKMAIVSQDTFVFDKTVKENIAYGVEGCNDSDIFEAAKLANALEFIQNLPDEFETVLGDRGVRLSGGQRQRIAIARALLRNPEILILDEATSALDSVTERLIQESLERLSEGRTVIAIAHRLSTISNADKVVVLDKGRIVEKGRYEELLKRRGKLWEYHEMQYGLNQS